MRHEKSRIIVLLQSVREATVNLRLGINSYLEANEFLLKLFFGSTASPGDCRALINEHRDYHASLLKKFRDNEANTVEGPNTRERKAYALATLGYGRAVSLALIAWSDATISSLPGLNR